MVICRPKISKNVRDKYVKGHQKLSHCIGLGRKTKYSCIIPQLEYRVSVVMAIMSKEKEHNVPKIENITEALGAMNGLGVPETTGWIALS